MSPAIAATPTPAPTPEERSVARYDGAELFNAGAFVRIRFSNGPRPGVRPLLRCANFIPQRDGSWLANQTPETIFAAQDALNIFHGSALE